MSEPIASNSSNADHRTCAPSTQPTEKIRHMSVFPASAMPNHNLSTIEQHQTSMTVAADDKNDREQQAVVDNQQMYTQLENDLVSPAKRASHAGPSKQRKQQQKVTKPQKPQTPGLTIHKKRTCIFPLTTKRKGSAAIASNGGRGSGLSQQEVDSMLELLKEALPLGREEWEYVLRKHNDRYPEQNRTVDSLKRKFASLHRRKVPTSDPTIPPDVEFAKKIRYRMTERADIGDGEDLDEEEGTESRENTPSAAASIRNPRPLVRKIVTENEGVSTADIIELYKLQMVQDQTRRAEEKEMREREGKMRGSGARSRGLIVFVRIN